MSTSGRAHPPRSNPPLRSSSDPPSPCITPSTETFVVTVSFISGDPFAVGRPSWPPAPCYRHTYPDPEESNGARVGVADYRVAMSKPELEELVVSNAEELRTWLLAHHTTST